MKFTENIKTTKNVTYAFDLQEIIQDLIKLGKLPNHLENVTVESDSKELFVYAESVAEKETNYTQEQLVFLSTPIKDLTIGTDQHHLSEKAQKVFRLNKIETLSRCIEILEIDWLKQRIFDKMILDELDVLFKEHKINVTI